MVLTCNSCYYMYNGSIFYDDLGWHGICPKCGCSFPVTVPDGRIIMAFADDESEASANESFVDSFFDSRIKSYYVFDTPENFIRAWKLMVNDPEGMWYFVLDNGEQFLSGACDEGDAEIIEEHFEIPVWEDGDEFDLPDPLETSPKCQTRAGEGRKHHCVGFAFGKGKPLIYADIIVTEPEHEFDDILATLEDSISSYIEAVDGWRYEQLVRENLDALGLQYTVFQAPEHIIKI